MSNNLSYKARTEDFDRYLCTLFAKTSVRESLFSLILFNSEIAKVRWVVSDPILGNIRLQWWRDAIEGIYNNNVLAHDIVGSLHSALKKHKYNKVYFDRLIDGRTKDFESVRMQSIADLVHYAEETSAPLLYLFLETILQTGERRDSAIFSYTREVGISWALTGLIRAWPHHYSKGHVMLPFDLLKDPELFPPDSFKATFEKTIFEALAEVGRVANSHLEEAAKLRGYISSTGLTIIHLLAVLCQVYLDRLSRCGFNPYLPESSIGPLRKQMLLSRVALLGF